MSGEPTNPYEERARAEKAGLLVEGILAVAARKPGTLTADTVEHACKTPAVRKAAEAYVRDRYPDKLRRPGSPATWKQVAERLHRHFDT